MAQRTFTITNEIIDLLPKELHDQFELGEEREFVVDLEWNAHGYAEVHSVSYMDIDCPDLCNEVEPTHEEEEEAKIDHEQAYGDYQYEQMKDRQMGL